MTPSPAQTPHLHLLDGLPAGSTLAALADDAPALLFACSVDGSDAYVNRQWLAYTGMPDAESLTARWREVTVPGDASPLADHPGDETDAGACLETAFRLRDAHGEYRWQLARARLARPPGGGAPMWTGVVQELALQPPPPPDNDEFFALVSHELRSPLNAIRGWAHVLRKSGQLSPMQERALDTIDRNIATQARMIDELLDRQRVLDGKVALERGRIELFALIDEAATSMQPAAAEKHIEFVVHRGEPILVDVDAARLRQVIVNLLSNALKFTPANGRVDVDARVHQAQAVIEVSDSGIGLAPEWVLRAFEPGQRHHGVGLGIGLTLAQRLVQLHGGRMSAHSEGPDRGSTFRVELPLHVHAQGQSGANELLHGHAADKVP